MKVHFTKKAYAVNGDEHDYLHGKKWLCVFKNNPNPARKTKRKMTRRLRASSKIIARMFKNEIAL